MNISDFSKITVGVLQGYFTNKSVLDKLSDSSGELLYDSMPVTDLSDYYTKSQVYTKAETNSALAAKADASSAVTAAVNNLQNYYLKSETYTKSEVNALIQAIPTMGFEVVNVLPTSNISTTTIYLVANANGSGTNVYDEYIRTTNGWEVLGQVTASVDLSELANYIAKTDFNYATNSDINTLMSTYPITTNAITNGNLQSNTIPTASVDYVGKIVQYTGTTTSTYTNGYFYKCVENNGNYSWTAINVQESGGSGGSSSGGSIISARDYSMFGFRIRYRQSDPEMIEYLADAKDMIPAYMDFTNNTFSYGSWEELIKDWAQPCMLTYGGEVDYYLDPDDYTKRKDGTASDISDENYNGNVMIKRSWNNKPMWYKVVPMDGGDSACIYIADKKVDDDFHCWSFINNQGQQVNSYYTAAYNGSVINGKLRSLSGKQVSNKTTRQQEVNYAKANNTDEDVLWYTDVYCDWLLDQYLCWLIGANLNTQSQFGRGLCDNGTEAINNSFRTGIQNTKGLCYGTNSGTANVYTNAVKMFGRENLWGFQWRGIAGWINANGTQKVKLTYGTEDGSTASAYNFDGTGYITIGAAPSGTNGGYINRMRFNGLGLSVPYISSGSESTYYCDGLWFNNSQNNYALVSGSSDYGSQVGVSYSNLHNLSSNSAWSIGVALSCKPLA